jgi:AcrR family transcriptional regulator
MAKQSYHHGDLKNALLTTAERLLEKNGVAGITLREVAKAAGVSHSAPYRHFADKQALLASLAQIGYQRLANAMQECAAKAAGDPLGQLRLATLAYVHLATRHPEMTYLMFGGALNPFDRNPALLEAANNAFEGLLKIIRNGQAVGVYKDKDTQTLAMAAWSQVHGLSMLITGKQMADLSKPELDHLTQEMVELLYNGLKAN